MINGGGGITSYKDASEEEDDEKLAEDKETTLGLWSRQRDDSDKQYLLTSTN